MIEFRRVNIGRDSFGVMHYVVEALGLPEGMSCRMSPEEADRPSGEWMVNAKAAGKRRTIRCKSKKAVSSLKSISRQLRHVGHCLESPDEFLE